MNRQREHLSVGRNAKIGLFHLGSGMADVLATGVWNRIMISDLGFSATPIGLLLSLRYFLAPLGVWAGRMSDEVALGGYRRLVWIYLGRLLMLISLLVLGAVTAALAQGEAATAAVWAALGAALLLFSLGNAISGSTFLALVYDRAPAHQRGRAVGIVWTFLLVGYSVGGVVFGLLLPERRGHPGIESFGGAGLADHFRSAAALRFAPETLLTLFSTAALIMGALWFFALLGEERRVSRTERENGQRNPAPETASLAHDLQSAWREPQMRLFFAYLSLSMICAFAQDLILEPFGGDVFNMDARHTTRFAAYWGTMAILGTLVFLVLARRFPRLTHRVMCQWGVLVLIATFAVFGVSALAYVRGLVTPGLILLGIGLGIWNVGTLGMMMDMSPFGRAGTFLGFWTLVSTLARGVGVSGGGIARDAILHLTGSLNGAYGAVFVLEALGLLAAWVILSHIVSDQPAAQTDSAAVFAGAMD